MVSLPSLLLNVAQNFRISAPDSQQLSQDLSQNHSILCPNIGPLILTSHQDERFLNYEVKASCLLNGTLHRHCIVMETGCSDYSVLGQACFLHHRSRLDRRHMDSNHFAAFRLKGHYSGVIIQPQIWFCLMFFSLLWMRQTGMWLPSTFSVLFHNKCVKMVWTCLPEWGLVCWPCIMGWEFLLSRLAEWDASFEQEAKIKASAYFSMHSVAVFNLFITDDVVCLSVC